MAVTTLRAARPGSGHSEDERALGASYERYLRSSKVDLLQRRKSSAASIRECVLTDVEDLSNSDDAGMGEPPGGPSEGDVPAATAKSNVSVQTDNGTGGRRTVMSARFRTVSCPGEYVTQLPQRPKTATVSSAEQPTQASAAAHSHRRWSLNENGLQSNRAQNRSSSDENEGLARSFAWSTATQRAYIDAGWGDRMSASLGPTPTSREPTPDPVTPQLNVRRYHSSPEIWQIVTPEWDFVQTRVRSYGTSQPGTNFCSPYKQQQQLPGYFGYTPGRDELDSPCGVFSAQMLIRSLQPSGTNISRKANIPGYMGHVHWTKMSPPNSADHLTSARVHRRIPLEEEASPFRRSSPLSKMITLVPPHNPFKRIDQ